MLSQRNYELPATQHALSNELLLKIFLVLKAEQEGLKITQGEKVEGNHATDWTIRVHGFDEDRSTAVLVIGVTRNTSGATLAHPRVYITGRPCWIEDAWTLVLGIVYRVALVPLQYLFPGDRVASGIWKFGKWEGPLRTLFHAREAHPSINLLGVGPTFVHIYDHHLIKRYNYRYSTVELSTDLVWL